jgi:hypothetical protein
MVNVPPNQKKMFRLTVTTRTGLGRDKHLGPEPRQPRNWLQRLGVVTAGLVFLPIALFSFTVFIGLFLSMIAVVMVYGLCLRSKFKREFKRTQSRHTVNSEVVSDEDDHEKLLN